MSQTFLKPQPHNYVWVFYQSCVFVSNLQGSTTTNQQTFQYLHIDKKCVEQYADIYIHDCLPMGKNTIYRACSKDHCSFKVNAYGHQHLKTMLYSFKTTKNIQLNSSFMTSWYF